MNTLRTEVDRIIQEFMEYLKYNFRKAIDNLLVKLQELDIIGNQSYDYDRVIMELLRTYQQSINLEQMGRQWDYMLFGSFNAGYGDKIGAWAEYSKIVALSASTAIMMGTLNTSIQQQIRQLKGANWHDQLTALYDYALTRGETMAITEFHRAAIAGQLSNFIRLHTRFVKYQTALDELVCPICSPLNNHIFPITDIKGMIPQHPRCRCYWEVVKETE